MSLYDYMKSQEIDKLDVPFASLIMSAVKKADTNNLEKIRYVFPEIYAETEARYHAPGGILSEDEST